MPIASLAIEGLRGFADAQTLELAIPTGEIGSGLRACPRRCLSGVERPPST